MVLSTPNSNFLTNILDFAWYLGHRHYRKEHLTNILKNAGFKIKKLEIRGGLWFSVYLIWHYFTKWILRKPLVVNKFLMEKDDKQFLERGYPYDNTYSVEDFASSIIFATANACFKSEIGFSSPLITLVK